MILVTGASGCIGSNLCARLTELGHDVRALVRPASNLLALRGVPVRCVSGDVTDPPSLRAAMEGCDTVFHAAAIVSFRRSLMEEQHRVNVLGTRAVVQACLESGVQTLVHTSSVAALGWAPDGELTREEEPYSLPAERGYRASKHLSELEVLAGAAQGLRAVIVNPSVVLGERDVNFRGGQIVRDVRRGLTLFAIKGGMNVVWVGDVVEGHIAAAERGRTGERYILSGENLTHREVFERTARVVGGLRPVALIPVPLLRFAAGVMEDAAGILGTTPVLSRDIVAAAGRHQWYSCAKAEKELGYRPHGFEHAVRAAFDWYVRNGLMG